jgi:acetyl-CoA carboxylase biotin carboxylase subunit
MPLSFTQQDVRFVGHAIEFRINAEAPLVGFVPSPGILDTWVPPTGAGIRTDTHCFAGYAVPTYYDSLLAKLICHGTDRSAALTLAARALDAFVIEGVETTLALHRALVRHPDVRENRITTRWVEESFLPGWVREHAQSQESIGLS